MVVHASVLRAQEHKDKAHGQRHLGQVLQELALGQAHKGQGRPHHVVHLAHQHRADLRACRDAAHDVLHVLLLLLQGNQANVHTIRLHTNTGKWGVEDEHAGEEGMGLLSQSFFTVSDKQVLLWGGGNGLTLTVILHCQWQTGTSLGRREWAYSHSHSSLSVTNRYFLKVRISDGNNSGGRPQSLLLSKGEKDMHWSFLSEWMICNCLCPWPVGWTSMKNRNRFSGIFTETNLDEHFTETNSEEHSFRQTHLRWNSVILAQSKWKGGGGGGGGGGGDSTDWRFYNSHV